MPDAKKKKSATGAKLEIPSEVHQLWEAAVKARKKSYSPYSKFAVGAALQSGDKLITGCNVENASYGGTVCAERVAVLKAVSEGVKDIERIVIVAEGAKPVPPCGFCLQTLAEFGDSDLEIWLADTKAVRAKFFMKDLLPVSFSSRDFKSH